MVADTYENAKAAAKLVEISYQDLPAVFTIEDAVEAKSFFPTTARRLGDGDVQKCFESGQCEYIREGKVQVGGQEHFYLEPNSTLVWTVDGGNEIHMVSSTQVRYRANTFTIKNVLWVLICVKTFALSEAFFC